MARSTQLFMVVVSETGVTVRIPVTEEEYTRFIAAVRAKESDDADDMGQGVSFHLRHNGVDANNTPYSLAFRSKTFGVWLMGGDAARDALTATFVHEKGGVMQLRIAPSEYKKVTDRFETNASEENGPIYYGVSASGHPFRAVLDHNTFAVSAVPPEPAERTLGR